MRAKTFKELDRTLPETAIEASGRVLAEAPCWEQAVAILEEEANVLARWDDETKSTAMPPRVRIAVSREIKRLRKIAEAIAFNAKNTMGAWKNES